MLTKEELPECPVATTVSLIGSKWKMMVSLFAPFTRRFPQELSTASANLDLL